MTAVRQREDIGGPSVIAYTTEGEGQLEVRQAGQEHAREHGCVLLLYTADAGGILSDPMPNAIDAEGADNEFGDRLGLADLEYLGRSDVAKQVVESRMAGARTAAWLPKDRGMAALADYATEQDAHIVFLPGRLPASDELTGLLTGNKEKSDLEGSGIEVRAVDDGAG
jgi:hypothetical protein